MWINSTRSFFKQLFYIVVLTGLTVNSAFSQTYQAGYREYKTQDTSRRYKPHTTKEDALFFRPVEIDVWYPAKTGANQPSIPYYYFLSLFERRANSFQDSTKYTGLADELMQQFNIANNLSEEKTSASLKTKSYLNAEEVKGPFPVIIYMAAFNGMSYENVPLFENLASHGYIVISISSVGRYPGDMTTKYPDLLEQVNDADFAIRFMQNKSIITDNIGIMGYSYGGLAATVLAMQNRSIKALLSLDGSETYYYGMEKQEDADFNALRTSKYFDPSAIQCPYAYLESYDEDGTADSIYHLKTAPGIKNYYLRLTNSTHEDFSCLTSLIVTNPAYSLVNNLSLNFFDEFLKGKSSVFANSVTHIVTSKKGLTSPVIKTEAKKINAATNIILKGKIISGTDKASIPYVSIGVLSRNTGTVSDNNGVFSLKLTDTSGNDTIRISSLGYKPRSFTVNELTQLLTGKSVVTLDEQHNQLPEIVINAKKIRIKTIGNTSKSKFFSVGFSLHDLGSEAGVKISLGKKKMLLRSFNFTISYNQMDSAIFRFNVYELKNGMPAQNLLTQNILLAIGNKAGTYSINLKPYKLLLKGDVLASLEWIAGIAASSNGAVFFSAGLLSSSYHRKTTEASWTRSKGLGAGFNLQVQQSE